MTTPFQVKPILVGDLVTLRPIQAEDADLIDRIIRDDEIARLTGSIHRGDEASMDLPIERLREIYGAWATAEDRLVLGVVDNASGEVVLDEWDEGNRSCGFRILIGAAGRGQGLDTEATQLIVEHGLRTMGLHRISLEVYDFNPRARHVYDKVGFVHEGTGREALLFDGEWINVHYMAIIGN
jgi:RimJ/RimL family protein N-acetyltransferase